MINIIIACLIFLIIVICIHVFPRISIYNINEFSILKNFDGLFEKLYIAANKDIPRKIMFRILEEWDLRINVFGNEKLKTEWKSLLNQYIPADNLNAAAYIEYEDFQVMFQKWYAFITKMGVIRDRTKIFRIENNSTKYYLFEETYNIGDDAKVDIPCFTYKNTASILQKGIAKIIY